MTYEEWYADNEMSGWTEAEYMIGFKAWNAGFEEAKRLTLEKFPIIDHDFHAHDNEQDKATWNSIKPDWKRD